MASLHGCGCYWHIRLDTFVPSHDHRFDECRCACFRIVGRNPSSFGGHFQGGISKNPNYFGFGFALFAIWMISQSQRRRDGYRRSSLRLENCLCLAGIGFGSYFVLMHEATSTGATIWPMVASRFGGMLLISAYMLITHVSWKVEDTSAWPMLTLNGILDVSGNVFFILAGQAGRLDVAAVLSSLFPGATVVLAVDIPQRTPFPPSVDRDCLSLSRYRVDDGFSRLYIKRECDLEH